MDAQEHPVRHFEQMIRLVERLLPLPAQLLQHVYSFEAFGSWSCIVRCRGVPIRIAFDGRDRELVVERSRSRRPPYVWDPPIWRRAGVEDVDLVGPELAAAVKRAAEAE
ncbi:MAG TPA: hypothetical protein VNO86_09575 [Candidatus Binatia bacterium]|nr:hypothetical protein [Candidatus Binatia bacterium]